MVKEEIEKALVAINRVIAEYRSYALHTLDEEIQLGYLEQASEALDQFLHVVKTCQPTQKANFGQSSVASS